MIDLHTHTTASDGRCSPEGLVSRAAAAGVSTLGVTDHDTVAACADVERACAAAGLQFVAGIEVTAVLEGSDVHMLGYFIDPLSPALLDFLGAARQLRLDRVRAILERLARQGIELDADDVLRPGLADSRKAAGRPWVARALVDAGYVTGTDEAFDRWLARGRPAFVPRVGASPEEVIERLHHAGGLVSLAHPGLTRVDPRIGGFVAAGLDALEAYHSRHDEATTAHYLTMVGHLGVLITGGSDFHGDPFHGPSEPGSVTLPEEAFERLLQRAAR
ncbi:MAG: PHP domain-containing protein [Acidimicrobiia bacterium]|nr:PHP domain-containing protein [Acidimicrobiia bacterium]